MSSNAGRYTPVAGQPVNVDTGTPWEYIRIINSSPYALSLSLGGQGTIDFPEMYLEDIKIQPSYNGKLNFTPFSNISNPAAALTNYVSINVYQPGEIRQPQAQPLTTMANVGNSVPLSANATSITNDGNASGTQFIEATPSGGSTTVSVKNDGSATLTPISTVFFPLTIIVPTNGLEAIHWVPADATKEVFSWYRNLNANNLAFEIFREAANGFTALEYFDVDNAGNLHLPNGHGHISVLHSIGATGTITHGLGYTPVEMKTESSQNGFVCMAGHDTAGSTTYHVTLSASVTCDSYAG